MSQARTILYVGTYERDYPRNQQLIRLLRLNDCDVEEIHYPVWERVQDKSRGFGVAGAARLAFRLIAAYFSLVVRVVTRLRSADAVCIGYIGQLDMIVLGPIVRLARIPLIFNPLVSLTDTLVEDREIVPHRSLVARVIYLLDYLALRLASVVIIDTEQNANYFTDRFGLGRNRMLQVHVGADEGVFRKDGETPAKSPEPDRLHVLFYGKMIPLHGVETILDAVGRLQSEPGMTFEIIGSGQLQERVTEHLARHPDESVVYRPWVAYSRLPKRIATADCVLGVFGTSDKSSRVVPNKVFQAMAMGAAIVTRDSPAIREVLTDGQSALLVPPGDAGALIDAICRLRDPDLRGRLGQHARQAFERHGSDEVLAHTLGDMLDRIVPAACSVEESDWISR